MTDVVRTRSGYAPSLDETRYIPQNPEQARQLYEALISVGGVSSARARTMIATLQTLPERYSNSFRVELVRYREVLKKLDGPPWEGSSGGDDPGAFGSVHVLRGWRSRRHHRPRQAEMLAL